jgi:hypothetical protein
MLSAMLLLVPRLPEGLVCLHQHPSHCYQHPSALLVLPLLLLLIASSLLTM